MGRCAPLILPTWQDRCALAGPLQLQLAAAHGQGLVRILGALGAPPKQRVSPALCHPCTRPAVLKATLPAMAGGQAVADYSLTAAPGLSSPCPFLGLQVLTLWGQSSPVPA